MSPPQPFPATGK